MTDLGSTMLINAAALLTVILALWAYSVKIRDVSFIDAFWAFGVTGLGDLGAVKRAGRKVPPAAWSDQPVGLTSHLSSVDTLARAWRRPALRKDYGQRHGKERLELEQDVFAFGVSHTSAVALHNCPTRATWYLGKRRWALSVGPVGIFRRHHCDHRHIV